MTIDGDFWRELYGERSNEFIDGVIAGISMYAVYDNGKQYVGVIRKPLLDVIDEVKEGLGYKEEKK